jgi:hypothetical protein
MSTWKFGFHPSETAQIDCHSDSLHHVQQMPCAIQSMSSPDKREDLSLMWIRTNIANLIKM